MSERFRPNTTVAAVIERGGRFLLVEEQTDAGVRLNQPAGHLEAGESLLDAVRREVLEEAGYAFTPEGLVGVYLAPGKTTYLRFAFYGSVGDAPVSTQLDSGIIAARWLDYDALVASADRLRSALVTRCVDDWRAGARHPLSLLHTLP